MQEAAGSRLNPLVAGAAVAVIIASGVGVAAVTGLLPGSKAEKAEVQPAAQVAAPAAPPQAQAAPAKRAAAEKPRTHTQLASASGTAKAACADCAVVVGVNEVQVKGESTGLGAVAGGVGGAVLGNQVGSGNTRTVITVAGAAAGALAGNELEKHARAHKRFDIALRMEDGSSRTVQTDAAPTWRSGDRVRLVNGQIQPR